MTTHTAERTQLDTTSEAVEAYWEELSDQTSPLHGDYYRYVSPVSFLASNLNDDSKEIMLSDETNHPGSNSFKARNGALSVAVLRREQPDVRTIHIASHSNAGMGFVRPATEAGLRVVMHADSQLDQARKQDLEAKGAEVVIVPSTRFEDAAVSAAESGAQPGHITGEAFRGVLPKAAHGMWAVEAVRKLLYMEKRGQVDLSAGVDLRLAVAGGGFVSGSALAVKYLEKRGEAPEGLFRVYGAQAEGCDAATQLRNQALYGTNIREDFVPDHRIASCAVSETCNDAQTIINDPEYVQSMDVVSLDKLAEAMRTAARRTGHIVEPAGALSLAACLEYVRSHEATDKRLQVAVVCGKAATVDQFSEFMGMLPDEMSESLARIWA